MVKWKVSILQATDWEAGRSEVGVHVDSAAEVQAVRVRTTHRATPIAAGRADTEERSIAEVAVARQGPFERGSKSTHAVILAPT